VNLAKKCKINKSDKWSKGNTAVEEEKENSNGKNRSIGYSDPYDWRKMSNIRNAWSRTKVKYEKKWILLGDFSFLNFLCNDLRERNGKLRNSQREEEDEEEEKVREESKRLQVSPW